MITRRQYFSIVLIFIAVFLMFQGTQASKSYLNPYDTNAHTEDADLHSANVFFGEEGALPTGPRIQPYFLYVGSSDSQHAKVIREWAGYSKTDLRFIDRFPSTLPNELPRVLLIDTEQLSTLKNSTESLLNAGVTIVCMGLPDAQELKHDDRLCTFLGVREVRTEAVSLHGLHLFQGFYLGGERIYEVENEEDEERQDLVLRYPWFRLDTGTKVYLQGILNEDGKQAIKEGRLRNEDLPALIWRKSYQQGAVYVVPGPFMDDLWIGMGTLSAIVGQMLTCQIYPVVNARVVSVLNFPVASDENDQRMTQVYGRSQTDLEENVVLPMLISQAIKNRMRFTCGMAPQYDYEDDALPVNGIVERYLNRFNEAETEMALSLLCRGDTPLSERVDADSAYFDAQGLEYRFSAVCLPGSEIDELGKYKDTALLGGIRTVLCDYDGSRPVLGYLERDLTIQQFTQRETAHTYTDDLRLLGLETALGYSNSCFDMAQAMWPDARSDQWELLSEKIFSNVSTYSRPFTAFDSLTASESDLRVRRFLALDYTFSRSDDTVTLFIKNFNQEAFFVLRTYGEEIGDISGADWAKIEDNAYLIKANTARVIFTLTKTDNPHYR